MKSLRDLPLLPTTIVGSYPQPEWLIDRQRLKQRLPPRVRAAELWMVKEPWLADAQEAATLVAISDQKLAGIDIVGDGEMLGRPRTGVTAEVWRYERWPEGAADYPLAR